MDEPITLTCAICRTRFQVIPPPTFDGVKPYAEVIKESQPLCWTCWKGLSQPPRRAG